MNYIRYHISSKTYSFRRLNQDKYLELSDEEKVEYLEQQMIWALNEDEDKLQELMDDAKQKALGK